MGGHHRGVAVPLHRRRIAALRARLGVLLLERGAVAVRTDDLSVPVQEWCDAAAEAGREVQRPVRTGLAKQGTVLWAVVTDWPRTLEELRRAAALAAPRLRLEAELGARAEPGTRDDEGRSSVG